jgi:hypothetical protein
VFSIFPTATKLDAIEIVKKSAFQDFIWLENCIIQHSTRPGFALPSRGGDRKGVFMEIAETGMGERLEPSASREAAPNYSLFAGAYFPDVALERPAGTDVRLSNYGGLADSLLVKPKERFTSSSGEFSEVVSLNQLLADRIASHCFEPALKHGRSANLQPPYLSPNRQLPGKDSADIIEHEKQRWSSIFECIKLGAGVIAAQRWAPQHMPKVTPLAYLTAKNPTGVHQMLYSGPTHAELVREMKARYTATCVGGMAAGWFASHLADKILFPHDQYMEATLAGDLSGIGLAIAVPGFPKKAALVAASHLLGKTIDHWRQPQYARKSNP